MGAVFWASFSQYVSATQTLPSDAVVLLLRVEPVEITLHVGNVLCSKVITSSDRWKELHPSRACPLNGRPQAFLSDGVKLIPEPRSVSDMLGGEGQNPPSVYGESRA